MPSAAEECRKPSGNCQGISHCLESGHPAMMLCSEHAHNSEQRTQKSVKQHNVMWIG